ncbi:hypothetical protein MRB53_031340 [Persea americana]|uniref:Uncharacterized protein n=2 Tax=Persea americana TaxID=3435 RepID=A0ACC2KNP3_PERAE|nr:hypothetical protein MRB53_031339 [Persea americana]KAJ8622811.1 hypothetical protein MRB53_031340 [Persea americana]
MANPAIRTTRSRVLRCIAITALVLIIAIAAIVLILWLVVRPAQVTYTVEDGSIHDFNVKNTTLNATFDFSIRAHNPNSKVAIYYDYINLSVWFDDQMIASKDVPPFFQPHRNATRLEVEAMTRSMPLMSSVARNIDHHKLSRGLEVEVRLRARIRFKVGRWKSRKYHARVYCSPVVLYHDPSKFDRTYCDVDI